MQPSGPTERQRLVAKWANDVVDHVGDENPYQALEAAWRCAVESRGCNPSEERARVQGRVQLNGEEPIYVIANELISGSLPPPELLLTFAELLHDYLQGENPGPGQLERVMFGAPPRKAGTYAKRFQRMRSAAMAGLHLLNQSWKGISKEKAAENLLSRDKSEEDAASFVRKTNRNDPLAKERAEVSRQLRAARKKDAKKSKDE